MIREVLLFLRPSLNERGEITKALLELPRDADLDHSLPARPAQRAKRDDLPYTPRAYVSLSALETREKLRSEETKVGREALKLLGIDLNAERASARPRRGPNRYGKTCHS